MEKLALGSALVAPVLALALVAAARPPANEAAGEAQDVRSETGASDETSLTSDADGDVEPRSTSGERALGDGPRRGLLERPAAPAAGAITAARLLDRATLEARGRTGPVVQATWAAIAFNNDAWVGEARRELIEYLRGAAAREGDSFTEADARAIGKLQAGSGADVDGRLTAPTMAVLFASGFRFSALPVSRDVELDFFPGELEDLDAWGKEIREKVIQRGAGFRDIDPPPGEGRIYVRVDGRVVAGYRARGGPPAAIADINGHLAEPTKPGNYTLGSAHARVTSAWYNSQIPWGAEIRKTEDGYQYRRPRGLRWWWATDHAGSTLKKPFVPTDFDDLPEAWRDGLTVLLWNKNDFGPLAWNLVTSDQYVHTTPDAEQDATKGAPIAFIVSHGCVHIIPAERDEMMAHGYLRRDVRFIVRRTEEHLLPSLARLDVLHPKR